MLVGGWCLRAVALCGLSSMLLLVRFLTNSVSVPVVAVSALGWLPGSPQLLLSVIGTAFGFEWAVVVSRHIAAVGAAVLSCVSAR